MKDDNQLVYNINKKKYLLFEVPFTSAEAEVRETRQMKKIGCLVQGIKEIKECGFFTSGHIIINILVPEDVIEYFNKKWM